jgi:hypothetical protein
MNMKKSFLAIIAITVVCWSVCAQEKDVTLRDTLPAAVKISHYHLSRETGNRIIKLSEINTMVSATGEADAIKYIQTLPGIAIGAEGSSAFYVRGGNLGSNIITLDGVPVYGSSHLLGFSSAFSQEIISDTYFQVGGFTSEEGNLTASHISLTTKDGNSDEFRYKVSASNFLLGWSGRWPYCQKSIVYDRVIPNLTDRLGVQSRSDGIPKLFGQPQSCQCCCV